MEPLYGNHMYTRKGKDQLERIHRSVVHFINNDYKSRDDGCITNMMQDLELSPLKD